MPEALLHLDTEVSCSRVFEVLTDFELRPAWLELQSARHTSPLPVKMGSTFSEVNVWVGGVFEVAFHVLEFQVDRRLVYRSEETRGFSAQVEWDLSAEPLGTQISLSVALTLSGIARIFSPFAQRSLRRQLAGDTERLLALF